ncbi:hypothetical protein OPKNFCMD_1080 [Methylobacterium crusticola]|uniref:Uncharacterized protein n=1 Tax=Methylobacterium crusticola TaxID=1697972 RepID=A0ABQ4QT45_9HYPH|nr:hypothetical protein [Methylobacterium crusticola]GJD48362.1 hypothetical protein OPKNFCMD_1080 [Methylobacterium crusticola]
MSATTLRLLLAASLALGAGSAARAQQDGGGGGGDSGSGLSPYAVLSGNDRSAGINNGNYRAPRLDPYIQAYPRYGRPADPYRPAPRPPGGRPY